MEAEILYHFNLDPENWEDDKLIEYWQNLNWVSQKNYKF